MRVPLTAGAFFLSVVAAAGADPKDVIGVNASPGALQVIEEKCLHCHNRQRIEDAADRKEKVEQVLQRMEQNGAVVTPGEQEVIGHFWRQHPFRSK